MCLFTNIGRLNSSKFVTTSTGQYLAEIDTWIRNEPVVFCPGSKVYPTPAILKCRSSAAARYAFLTGTKKRVVTSSAIAIASKTPDI